MEKQVSGIENMEWDEIEHYVKIVNSRGGFDKDIRRHKFAIIMILLFGKYKGLDYSDLPSLSAWICNIKAIRAAMRQPKAK